MAKYHHGDLRAALMKRAIELIEEKGVEGLSLRQAAKDLGVSHAAPMRHFKSKADLLSAIVGDAYRELIAYIIEDVSKADLDNATARVRARVMVKSSIDWSMQNKAKFSAMINPDVRRFADDSLRKALSDFFAMVRVTVRGAKTEGFGADKSDMALLVYGVGAALGAGLIVTDELLQSIIGWTDDDKTVEEIAAQIIPEV